MTTPCKNCCIEPSCQAKFAHPISCRHKPQLDSKLNISDGYNNIGRKRIAIGGCSPGFSKIALDDHKIGIGLVEGWE